MTPLRIDLRSDTATRPTPAMRAAMAGAEVGDEQRGEDPTVRELETRAAALLGQEDAIFLPTATMANQIALSLLGRPGDELIVENGAHIVMAELGGAAVHAGLQVRGLEGERGMLSAERIHAASRPADDLHLPTTAGVALENTHNLAGGVVLPEDEVALVLSTCRERGIGTHLDGARLMNAAVASGVAPAELAGGFDTVSLCLSKGLGCPLGALLAGSRERMARARRLKHRFGGAMRQAGIVAAAGLHALDHHVERLADDHRRARRLAEGLANAGLTVDSARVQTNFVQVDVRPLGLDPEPALARVEATGIGLSWSLRAGIIRAVTHLDVGDDDIEEAVDAIPAALRA